MRLGLALATATLLALPWSAAAQSAAERTYVFGDVGRGRTWDDEGALGNGSSLTGGGGFRITERFAVQAIAERIAYRRDIEYLEFDGRVIFTGVEAAFHYTNRRVRPFWTIGAGMFNDDGFSVFKSIVDPRLPRQEERFERHFNLAAMTVSGGVDVPISDRLSIRAALRFHGLLDTGDDAAPHSMMHPSIGVRWKLK